MFRNTAKSTTWLIIRSQTFMENSVPIDLRVIRLLSRSRALTPRKSGTVRRHGGNHTLPGALSRSGEVALEFGYLDHNGSILKSPIETKQRGVHE